MEDYLERRDKKEAKQGKESTEDRNKEYQDKVSGEEMRERAMERLAQMKKRNGNDEPRKKRHKSNETLDYLREAAERKFKIRQDELEMKRKQEEGTMATQQALLTHLRDQQQLQMRPPHNSFMQMMLNIQQAQSQAFIELLRKGQYLWSNADNSIRHLVHLSIWTDNAVLFVTCLHSDTYSFQGD